MNPSRPNNHNLMLLAVCLTMLLSACLPAAIGPAAPGPLGTPGTCPPEILRALPNPDEAQNYVGWYVNDLNLPSGLTYKFGKLVPGKGDKDEDHIWSVYLKSDGSYLMVWGTLVCRGSKGSPYWQITDATATGPLAKDQIPANKCYKGKELIPYMLDVTDPTKSGKNNAELAWQADTQTNKIVQASTGGISCVSGNLP